MITIICIASVAFRSKEMQQKEELKSRLSQLKEDKDKEKIKKSQNPLGKFTISYRDFIEKHLPKNFAQKFRDLADQAGISMSEGEFFSFHVLSCLIISALFILLIKNIFISALLGLPGLLFPTFFLKFLIKLKISKFDSLLVDTIALIASTIQSGFAFRQAIQVVAEEMPPPINDEFKIVIQEMNLGLSQEEALNNLKKRMPSADLDLFITAVQIQSETGGNLSEILNKIGDTIKKRIQLKGDIKASTAQGKISGIIVGSMPFVIIGIVCLITPEYMKPLFSTPAGIGIILAALIMEGIGAFLVKKIITIDM
jgi:tight adherence protein B